MKTNLDSYKHGRETKHVKIGHVKIDRAHFRVHCREYWKISREHSRGSLRGDRLVRFKPKRTSTFMGISVDIFVYTLVGIFVSTFVREFVGRISRFACSVLFWKQGAGCWVNGNHRNHGNEENHGNPGCKPRVPQATGLEIPELCGNTYFCLLFGNLFTFLVTFR